MTKTMVDGALARATVLDEKGESRELASVWKDRPAVLAFVRHFG